MMISCVTGSADVPEGRWVQGTPVTRPFPDLPGTHEDIVSKTQRQHAKLVLYTLVIIALELFS